MRNDNKADKATRKRITENNRYNPYTDVTPLELGYRYPIVHYPNNINLKPGEIIIYASPASTFKDREQVIGYTGKSAGVSVHIAKGLTYHTGGNAGRPIRQNVRKFNPGDLIVTNFRVIFSGIEDYFEYTLSSISVSRPIYSDAILIQKSNSSKNVCFPNSTITSYAITMLKTMSDAHGVIDPALLRNLSSDEINKCNSLNTHLKVSKKSSFKKGATNGTSKFVITMFAIIATGIIIGVILNNMADSYDSNNNASNTTSEKSASEIKVYSELQIVTFKNHPRVFGSYKNAQKFYSDKGFDVSDEDKSKVVVTSPHYQLDTGKYLLCWESTYEDYLQEFTINLSQKASKDLTLENLEKIAGTYLPNNFSKYYRVDAEYKGTSEDGSKWYLYSTRQNQAGEKYAEKHSNYPYYYAIHFYLNKDGTAGIYGDLSAYGGSDIGWLQNYGKKWNSGFKKYIGK